MILSFLPGVGRQGLLPSQKRVLDQFFRAQHCLGLGKVVGQLRRVGPSIGSVEHLQGLGDLGVQPHLPGHGQFPGQGLLNQRVGELVTGQGLGNLLNYPGG